VTPGAWALLGLAGLLAAGDWLAVARGSTGLEYVWKPGALVALVGVAATLDPSYGDVRAWVVVALLLSLAGDVLLMLPSDRFVAGLASFLLAHIAYVVGLTRHGGSAAAVAIAAIPVVAVASGVVLAAVGAVLFMASDALIAETRFVGKRARAPVVIIVTYHLGQAGLTLSLVR